MLRLSCPTTAALQKKGLAAPTCTCCHALACLGGLRRSCVRPHTGSRSRSSQCSWRRDGHIRLCAAAQQETRQAVAQGNRRANVSCLGHTCTGAAAGTAMLCSRLELPSSAWHRPPPWQSCVRSDTVLLPLHAPSTALPVNGCSCASAGSQNVASGQQLSASVRAASRKRCAGGVLVCPGRASCSLWLPCHLLLQAVR